MAVTRIMIALGRCIAVVVGLVDHLLHEGLVLVLLDLLVVLVEGPRGPEPRAANPQNLAYHV